VEWVRQQVEAWNSGDVEGFLNAVPPKFEFTPDPSFPDAGTYSGQELREWIDQWNSTWEDSQLEILGIAEYERAVLMESRWHLAAPQTGGNIPVSDFNVVLWFEGEDDLPIRMAAFFDGERALSEAQGGTG
jgi:hypothetical protein